MATCTLVKSTAVTTNSTSYTQVVTGASVGDLIVAIIAGTATTGAASSTDNKGGTYILVSSASKASTADTAYIFVGDSLVTTSSFTINLGFTGDAATGGTIGIYAVSGMTLTGAAASRQTAVLSNASSAVTPAVTFGLAVSSSNPTIGALFSATAPTGVTVPSGWTLSTNLANSAPAAGLDCLFRDNTFNGTTITWGSTTTSAYAALMVELDTSTGAGPSAGPSYRTLMGVGR